MPTRQDALSHVLIRAADPAAFAAWKGAARSARFCRHPVRLVGDTAFADRDTGEVVARFGSVQLPDGILLKACGQRRASLCPPCSDVYRGDAWQLLVAGLRGGKGVAEVVGNSPAVLATFTAPSFGSVHSRRQSVGQGRRCRPNPGRSLCEHGGSRGCEAVHGDDDGTLGDPLCAECFDYVGAVLWNSTVTELWRRTALALESHLAQVGGVTRRSLRSEVRISYAKVVEYQRRGVVHLHVVVRLDEAEGRVSDAALPGPAALVGAVRRAADAAFAPVPATRGGPCEARWGRQVDVRVIGGQGSVARGAVAAYVAKYATKSTDDSGVLDHRLRNLEDLRGRDLRSHLARLAATAWELGGRPELEALRLRAWAHTLGFRGHWLTKSRRYSTTFRALREARFAWRSTSDPPLPDAVSMGAWRFAGRGWANSGDAWLADTAAEEAAEQRRIRRSERRASTPSPTPDGTDE